METSRRKFVVQGGAAFTGLALINTPFLAEAFPSRKGEEVVPWLDQPPANPVPEVVRSQLRWEDLDSWVTPNDRFFGVGHYNWPVIDEKAWTLEVTGLVKRPTTFTLSDLVARPRREVTFTLECSGNHGFPWFIGGIGTAKWAGTPLAPILEEAQVLDHGIEVVFFGSDAGEETVREIKMTQNFARSMSLADAMNPNNLLCYEMNEAQLPQAHGFPLRLIAPGWYGIANVKWLKRIEVRSSRFMNRFMARDYVTIREERHNGETEWVEILCWPGFAQVGTRQGDAERWPVPNHWCGLGRPCRERRGSDRWRAMAPRDHRPQRGSRLRVEGLVSRLGRRVAGRACDHLEGHRYRRERPASDGRPPDCRQAHLLGEQRTGHEAG